MSAEKPTKARLLEALDSLCTPNAAVLKFKKGDNLGPTLGSIFVWQETAKYAKDKLEAAWKVAVGDDLIDADEVLREGSIGEERILTESNGFSVVSKLDKPRESFDQEKFIETVAKRFRLDKAQLEKMAEGCMKQSKPPLHKRVIEA